MLAGAGGDTMLAGAEGSTTLAAVMSELRAVSAADGAVRVAEVADIPAAALHAGWIRDSGDMELDVDFAAMHICSLDGGINVVGRVADELHPQLTGHVTTLARQRTCSIASSLNKNVRFVNSMT